MNGRRLALAKVNDVPRQHSGRGTALLLALLLLSSMAIPLAHEADAAPVVVHPVFGYVESEGGSLIAGAQVVVTDVDSGFSQSVTSANDGYYQVDITDYDVGDNVSVEAEYDGITSVNHTEIPASTGASRVDVRLSVTVHPVFGTVYFPWGDPFPNVLVTVNHDGNSHQTTTDALGNYWVDLGPGWAPLEEVSVTAEDEGYYGRYTENPVEMPFRMDISLDDTIPPVVEASGPSHIGLGENLTVEVNITDNGMVEGGFLCYRHESAGEFDSQELVEEDGLWTATVGPFSDVGDIYWYAEGSDGFNTTRDPATGVYTTAVLDQTPPVIEHVPPSSIPSHLSHELTCSVTDEKSVEEVSITLKDLSGQWEEFTMTEMGADHSYTLPPQNDIGTVEYYITATDGSNLARSPENGTHAVAIVDEVPPNGTIEHEDEYHSHEPFFITLSGSDNIELSNATIYHRYLGEDVFEFQRIEANAGNFDFSFGVQNRTGILQFHCILNDTSGNQARIPFEGEVQANVTDVLPPSLHHEVPTEVEPFTEASFNATVRDDVNVTRVEFMHRTEADGSFSMKDCQHDPASGTWGATLVLGGSGTVEYFFRAYDGSNVGVLPLDAPSSYFILEVQDTSPPVMTASVPATVEIGEEPLIFINATDPSGIKSVKLTWNGIYTGTGFASWNGGSNYSFIFRTIEESGTVNFWIAVEDAEGNTVQEGAFTMECRDTVPPEIYHDGIDLHYVNSTFNVTCISTDNYDIDAVILNVTFPNGTTSSFAMVQDDGTAGSDWDGDGFSDAELYGHSLFTGNVSGQANYSIQATDVTGNQVRDPLAGNHSFLVVERDIPIITDLTEREVPRGQNMSFSALVEENGSYLSVVVEVLDGSLQGNYSMYLSSGNASKGIWVYDLGEPTHPFSLDYRIKVSDGTNNVSAPFDGSFNTLTVIDSSPPVVEYMQVSGNSAGEEVTLSARISDDWNVTAVQFQTFFDGEEGVTYQAELTDGGPPSNGTWTATVPPVMAVGWFHYKVSATDMSGKTVRFPEDFRRVYLRDASPPQVFLSLADEYSASKKTDVVCHVSDDIGVLSVRLHVGNQSYMMSRYSENEYRCTLDPFFEVVEKEIFAQVRDANNSNVSSIQKVAFADLEGPEVGSMSVKAFPAERSSAFYVKAWDDLNVSYLQVRLFVDGNWTLLNRTDEIAVPEDAYAFEVPATFFVGDTVVNVTANDGYNDVTKQFTIQFFDDEPPVIITHHPNPTEAGNAFSISISVDDKIAVEGVDLFFKIPGSTGFAIRHLLPTEDQNVTIPAIYGTGDFIYYVKATDGHHESRSPSTGYALIDIVDTTPPDVHEEVTENGWGKMASVKLSAEDALPVELSVCTLEYPDEGEIVVQPLRRTDGQGWVFEFDSPDQPGEVTYRYEVSDGTNVVEMNGTVVFADLVEPKAYILAPSLNTPHSASDPLQFKVRVIENYNVESALFFYRLSKEMTFSEMAFDEVINGTYVVEIPPQNVTGNLLFFVRISDGTTTVDNPENGTHVVTLKDMKDPEVSIISAPSDVHLNSEAIFKIRALDDIAVEEVKMVYFTADSNERREVSSVEGNDGVYTLKVPAGEETGSIDYWFEVTDGENTVVLMDGHEPFELTVDYNPYLQLVMALVIFALVTALFIREMVK